MYKLNLIISQIKDIKHTLTINQDINDYKYHAKNPVIILNKRYQYTAKNQKNQT